MKPAMLRNIISHSLNPKPLLNPKTFLLPPLCSRTGIHRFFSASPNEHQHQQPTSNNSPNLSSKEIMDHGFPYNKSGTCLHNQFEEFQRQMIYCKNKIDLIEVFTSQIEGVLKVVCKPSMAFIAMSTLDKHVSIADFVEKYDVVIDDIKSCLGDLHKHVIGPGEFLRYHAYWRDTTHKAVSFVAFTHWLKTGDLITRFEVEKRLEMHDWEYGLDIEDYLIGLCFMSNKLAQYAVNQVTAGDYDCPGKVFVFLTNLRGSIQAVTLRDSFLRQKFNEIDADLKKVQEVYDDLKVQGLDKDIFGREPKDASIGVKSGSHNSSEPNEKC